MTRSAQVLGKVSDFKSPREIHEKAFWGDLDIFCFPQGKDFVLYSWF